MRLGNEILGLEQEIATREGALRAVYDARQSSDLEQPADSVRAQALRELAAAYEKQEAVIEGKYRGRNETDSDVLEAAPGCGCLTALGGCVGGGVGARALVGALGGFAIGFVIALLYYAFLRIRRGEQQRLYTFAAGRAHEAYACESERIEADWTRDRSLQLEERSRQLEEWKAERRRELEPAVVHLREALMRKREQLAKAKQAVDI